jgi:hypothetical protein
MGDAGRLKFAMPTARMRFTTNITAAGRETSDFRIAFVAECDRSGGDAGDDAVVKFTGGSSLVIGGFFHDSLQLKVESL